MADDVIETLRVKVESDSKKATNNLDALIAKLESLKGAVSNIDLSQLSKPFGDFSNTIKNMNGSEIDGFTKSIEKMNTILPDFAKNLDLVSNSTGIKELENFLNYLKATDLGGVNSMISSIENLTNTVLNLDIIGGAFDHIKKAIESLGMMQIDNAIENVNRVTVALEPLGNAVAALPALGNSSNYFQDIIQLANALNLLSVVDTDSLSSVVDALSTNIPTLAGALSTLTGTTDSAKSIAKLTDAFRKFSTVDVGMMQSAMDAMQDMMRDLKPTLDYISGVQDASTNIRKLVDAFRKFSGIDTDSLRTAGTVLNDILGALTPTLDLLSGSADAAKNIAKLPKAFNSLLAIDTDALRTKIEELNDILQPFSNTIGNMSAFSGIYNTIAKSKPTAQTATSYSKVPSLVKSFLISPFKKFGSTLSDVSKKFSGFMSKIGRIALYRAIRSAISAVTKSIKEGVDNLYQYSKAINGDFANSLDNISTSTLYLKNSLGAMAAPIINAVAPAITFLVNKIVSLTNSISQLFAVLGGKSTYTRAIAAQTEYAEASGAAAGAAADAAAETKKSILAFDELNVLTDNSSSGSSGSSGGASVSDMFEEVNIGDSFQHIKDLFENSTLYDIGETIAGKLNDSIKTVDEWLTGTLEPKAEKWAGDFATLLNGLVDGFDGFQLGKTIGDGLNVITTSINSFFSKFDVLALGQKLGDALNGIVNAVKWDSLGEAFSNYVNSALDLARGFTFKADFKKIGSSITQSILSFFGNINWDGITQTFSNLVSGAFDFASGVLQAIRSKDLIAEIGGAIMDFVGGVDMAKIMQSAGEFLGNVISTSKSIIESIVSGIKTCFSNALSRFKSDNWLQGFGFTTDFEYMIFGIFKDVFYNLPIKLIGAFKEYVWQPFVNGIKSVIGDKSGGEIVFDFTALTAGILSAKKIVGLLVTAFKQLPVVITLVKTAANALFGTWWGVAIGAAVALVVEIIDRWKEFGNLTDALKSLWSDFCTWITGLWNGLVSVFSNKSDSAGESVVNLEAVSTDAYNKISKQVGYTTEAVSDNSDGLKEAVSVAKTQYKEMKQSCKESLSEQIDLWGDVADKSDISVKQMIDNIKQQTKANKDYLENFRLITNSQIQISDGLMSKLNDGSEEAKLLAQKLAEALASGNGDLVNELSEAYSQYEQTTNIISEQVAATTSYIQNDVGTFGTTIDEYIGECKRLAPELSTVGTNAGNSFTSAVKSVIDSEKQRTDFYNIGLSLCGKVKNGFTAVKSSFTNVGSEIGSAFSNGLKSALKANIVVDNPFYKTSSTTTSSKYTVKVSAHADGGVVPHGELFIAGEAGPEIIQTVGGNSSVTNTNQFAAQLEKANGGVVSAVYSMAKSVVSAIESNKTTLTIDSRNVTRAQNNANRRYGKTLQTV